LAARHDVPLAELVLVGVHGGLVAVVVLDLVLTWIGTPVGWLRQLVRVLSVGTVAANAVAGWLDVVAVRVARGGAADAAGHDRGRPYHLAAPNRPGAGHPAGADPAGSVGAGAVADISIVAADGVVVGE
jgi:hypothetical protein